MQEQKKKAQSEKLQTNGVNGDAPLRERTGATGPATNGINGFAKPVIPTGPRALRPGEIPTGPAAMRTSQPNKGYDMAPPPPPKPSAIGSSTAKSEKRPAIEEAQQNLIRQRYMGADQNQSTFSAKKKRRRTTEKKFNFEWNAEEDTSPDYNPLYQARAEANFYGRGRLGGFSDDLSDGVAQKYARALEERDHESGSARAQEMLEMERRRRRWSGAKSRDSDDRRF